MSITYISMGPVNCYLVHTKTGPILVDSGTPGTGPELAGALQAVGTDLSEIRLLLLTHGHYDHAGNAAWLQREHGIPVAIHEQEVDFVRTASMKVPQGTSLLARTIGCIFTLTRIKSSWEGFEPEIVLNSHTDLRAYGLDAGLIEFPGHTFGSIGLLFPNGDLISGDLVSNMRKPGLGMFGRDKEQMKRDIKGLKSLGVRVVYPGHGRPFGIESLKTD